MNDLSRTLSTLVAIVLALQGLATGDGIPAQLPRPDGKPGDMTRKVKVYILAGQSNMVGMGDITGAGPRYPRVFYSADPAIIPGATPIGRNSAGKPLDHVAVERHGVYDAKAAVYADGDVTKPPARMAPIALGTVAENLPATEGAQSVVVSAQIDVPATGNYFVHAGFGDSSHSVVTLDGKEVYRKDLGGKPALTKITLEKGKRYPVQIKYLKGGSAAFWLDQVDIPGNGDLVTITKRDKKFPYLLDDAGNWTVRSDVYFQEARLVEGGKGAPMSAEANKKCLPKCNSIGPEVGFGYVMGTFHDEPVLLIKTAQGNRSLRFDFRPPSSGQSATPASEYEGMEYRLMVKGVRATLENIAKVVPGYQGQGYEIAGFGWFQGHKDSGSTKEEYEKCLVNLIHDLRKEFNVPKMPVIVATVGFHGYRLSTGPWQGVWEAQMAVGDPKQHPEFAGTVASVDTRDFWREVEESPRSQDYHYNRNAETYMLVGEAMGRAMVRLLGGQAEPIPKSDREARVAAEVAAAAAKPAPTEAEKAAHVKAIAPLILDGALAAFLSNPRNQPALQAAIKAQKPAKGSPFLDDAIDDVVDFYQAAGIHDYDWRPFGDDLKNGAWDYFGFDLPGHPNRVNVSAASAAKDKAEPEDDDKAPPKGKGKAEARPPVKIVWPTGTENWFAPEFDTKKADWKSGAGPFGESAEKVVLPDWAKDYITRRVPKTLCGNDVLLLRRSLDLSPLKEGHRYRIRIAGSAHNNMGESYAIYVNDKLLGENHEGVLAWRRQGASPRGVSVYPEFRGLLSGGKVTLAVSSFAMDNFSPDRFIPPGAALSVWIEEMKLPPLGQVLP